MHPSYLGSFPHGISAQALVEYLKTVPGTEVKKFLNGAIESWIDFSYEGLSYSINDQFGDYLVFAENDRATPRHQEMAHKLFKDFVSAKLA